MSGGKFVVGILLIGALGAATIPLIMRDRNAAKISGGSAPTAAMGTEAASTGLGGSLGSYSGGAVTRETLTSEEKAKLFEAEQKLYEAAEEILVQRHVAAFFDEYRKQKNLPDTATAQQAYLAEKVKVSDDDVKKFLEEYKDNPGLKNIPEERRNVEVRNFLEGRQRSTVIRGLVEEARNAGAIKVSMAKPVEPRFNVDGGDNLPLGKADAPVTIVEYADYQCPACAQMVPVIQEVVKKNDGKVRWIFRDFPLQEIHPAALPAAIAASCAGAQGKYWEAHNLLFKSFRDLNEATYTRIAKEIGLDEAKFQECQKDPKVSAEVLADQKSGNELGVNGTPTYFVNGRRFSSGDVAAWTKVIDEEIAARKM